VVVNDRGRGWGWVCGRNSLHEQGLVGAVTAVDKRCCASDPEIESKVCKWLSTAGEGVGVRCVGG